MNAAGLPELAVTDVLVLHHAHHRDRGKKLADICFALNYEDTRIVSCALRKLAALGLGSGERQGKEVIGSTTLQAERGDEALAELAGTLRTLSGLYDQAARAAASL